MPLDFKNTLVVGVSSSSLFDLREADELFRQEGIQAYRAHMLQHENEPLRPGTAFPLVSAILRLNPFVEDGQGAATEVVVLSRNSPETGVRIMNSVREHKLLISRFAFTGGEPLAPFVKPFQLDLFLSQSDGDVQRVIDTGECAAAVLHAPPTHSDSPPTDQLRIAFDADAVLFHEKSEVVYKTAGLTAFHKNEDDSKNDPMSDGPFASFLRKLSVLQTRLPGPQEYNDVRISIVTARNAPAETRVITTLRSWGVYVDAAFFLGGLSKAEVLSALRPHIFFDDQKSHTLPASEYVPSGLVPYRSISELSETTDVVAHDRTKMVELSVSPADSADPEPSATVPVDGPARVGDEGPMDAEAARK